MDLLKGAKSSRSRIKWSLEAQGSFKGLKEALAAAIPLAFPNPNGTYRLYTDASDVGAGGVLVASDNLTKQTDIIGFFSKNFNSSERVQSVFDRELLAIIKAIKFLHVYIKFREFQLYSDNKDLYHCLKEKDFSNHPPITIRHLMALLQYNFNIYLIASGENVVADAMSWFIGMVGDQ